MQFASKAAFNKGNWKSVCGCMDFGFQKEEFKLYSNRRPSLLSTVVPKICISFQFKVKS